MNNPGWFDFVFVVVVLAVLALLAVLAFIALAFTYHFTGHTIFGIGA
jgi:hypothetical protein